MLDRAIEWDSPEKNEGQRFAGRTLQSLARLRQKWNLRPVQSVPIENNRITITRYCWRTGGEAGGCEAPCRTEGAGRAAGFLAGAGFAGAAGGTDSADAFAAGGGGSAGGPARSFL